MRNRSRGRLLCLLAGVFLTACSSSPVPPDWQLNSRNALTAFQSNYLKRRHARRGARVRQGRRRNCAARGAATCWRRAELVRCAVPRGEPGVRRLPGIREAARRRGPPKSWPTRSISPAAASTGGGRCFVAPRFPRVQFNSGKGNPRDHFLRDRPRLGTGLAPPLLAWLRRAGEALRSGGRPRGTGSVSVDGLRWCGVRERRGAARRLFASEA